MNVDNNSASPAARAQPKFLTRKEAAEHLKSMGVPMSGNTLAVLAWRGDGPRYSVFGRNALYRLDDLHSWIEQRTSSPASSTSEARR